MALPRFVRCTTLLVLALPCPTPGQEGPPRTRWGVELGLTSFQLRDEVLNVLRHRGTFGSLGAFRERSGPSVSGRLALEAAFVPVSTRYESGKNSFTAGLRLGYRRLYRSRAIADHLELHLGGTAEFYQHFAYFGDWDDSHGYWLTAYSLGPSAALRFLGWRDRTVSFEASMPLVGLVSRPDARILNKVDDNTFGAIVGKLHENLQPTSLHEHVAVDATLRLTRPRSRIGRSFFWRIFWLHNDMDHSATLTALRHTFGASAVF